MLQGILSSRRIKQQKFAYFAEEKKSSFNYVLKKMCMVQSECLFKREPSNLYLMMLQKRTSNA